MYILLLVNGSSRRQTMVNSLTDRRKAPYGDQLVATGGVLLYGTRCTIPKQFANVILKILFDP